MRWIQFEVRNSHLYIMKQYPIDFISEKNGTEADNTIRLQQWGDDVLSKINMALLNQVAEAYKIDLIVLFGSYAKRSARKGSDMDIAIRTTRTRSLSERDCSSEAFWEMSLYAALSRAIPAPEGIDLVILNQVDSAALLYEVATYGRPLYQQEAMTFHQFCSYAARRFYDDAKFRRWGWEYLKRRSKLANEKFDPVRRKLKSMLQYLDELQSHLPEQEADYLSAELMLHRGVERTCQMAIECAIDANSMLVSLKGHPPPDSARESFEVVHKFGGIDSETLRRFHETFVGFRNRLVHVYERVNHRIVFHTARMLIGHGKEYVENLTAYLEQQGRGTTTQEGELHGE